MKEYYLNKTYSKKSKEKNKELIKVMSPPCPHDQNPGGVLESSSVTHTRK